MAGRPIIIIVSMECTRFHLLWCNTQGIPRCGTFRYKLSKTTPLLPVRSFVVATPAPLLPDVAAHLLSRNAVQDHVESETIPSSVYDKVAHRLNVHHDEDISMAFGKW